MLQRYVLLYGVGKARDEARAAVKKLTKEICKLFSKKCSNDIAEGKMFALSSLFENDQLLKDITLMGCVFKSWNASSYSLHVVKGYSKRQS